MKKMHILMLLIITICLKAAPMTHDDLYMRINLGAGSGYANYENLFELNGVAGIFSIHIGGSVSENLILFGRVGAFSLSDPDVTLAGTFTFGSENTTYNVTGFGAGITYYLPYNFYLSGSLDLPIATLQVGDSEGSSEIGFGSELAVGKEWWISDEWAMGLAFTGQFAMMKDKGDFSANDIGNVCIGLQLSVTYD